MRSMRKSTRERSISDQERRDLDVELYAEPPRSFLRFLADLIGSFFR
jgi:hypothetical protein